MGNQNSIGKGAAEKEETTKVDIFCCAALLLFSKPTKRTNKEWSPLKD